MIRILGGKDESKFFSVIGYGRVEMGLSCSLGITRYSFLKTSIIFDCHWLVGNKLSQKSVLWLATRAGGDEISVRARDCPLYSIFLPRLFCQEGERLDTPFLCRALLRLTIVFLKKKKKKKKLAPLSQPIRSKTKLITAGAHMFFRP